MAHQTSPAVDSTLRTIGNTSVVRLRRVVPDQGSHAAVFVKLEYFNPTGSYKDRMALAMIEEAERRGALRPGMTVVEYSGGSTGSSLAFVCAVKGYRLVVVTSDAFAREKPRTMKAFGAQVEIIPSRGGAITPDLLPRMMTRARQPASEEGAYFTDQINNPDIIAGYEPLDRELARQVGAIDGFCASVGSPGMFMGVARILRGARPDSRLVILEPASAPRISLGRKGNHHVEGIGIGLIPPLLDRSYYDEARGVDEGEARAMARRLAREEGISGGVSTGLNVVGAIQIARELGAGSVVATVAVDSGLKYLDGDLFDA